MIGPFKELEKLNQELLKANFQNIRKGHDPRKKPKTE